MSRVLITGVTGQDGFSLADLCLAEGDDVFGMVRWTSHTQVERAELEADLRGIKLVDGDLTDPHSLRRAIELARPEIVYNLAALASSGQSWAQPMSMGAINALGPLNLLEAVRSYDESCVFLQASTSEQYGTDVPLAGTIPVGHHFGSLNSYGIAKTFAHEITVNYRKSYQLPAVTMLMHNHVSYRRNPYFVDRKITKAVAAIVAGRQKTLKLGNTAPIRDWGWGPEYMSAWRLVGESIACHTYSATDYVIATGIGYSVQEFVERAFDVAGLDWRKYVEHDDALYRPTDQPRLVGDPSLISSVLGWRARVGFDEIVERLVKHDLSHA